MISGKRIGELFEKWQAATPLSDKELDELIKGLEVISDFCYATRLNPLIVYYSSQVESLRRCQAMRKEK